jgi:glycosyltransferase involved in cell wall biosynthesis
MKTLIFIPAFNAEKHLSGVLDDLLLFKDDLLIVNDGSYDNTNRVIEQYGIRHITHPKNLGLSAAMRSGIDFAIKNKYTHFITLDADGQHPSRLVPKYIDALNDYDLVLANRYFEIDEIPHSKIGSNLFGSVIVKDIFHVVLKDISCGFRGFRINEFVHNLKSNDFGFIYEHLFLNIKNKINFTTVNVPAIYPQNTFLSTRVVELNSFIENVLPFCEETETFLKLSDLHNSINQGQDFVYFSSGYEFYGFYIQNHNSYIIQTPISAAKNFYNENCGYK